jgi:hypothetical protein
MIKENYVAKISVSQLDNKTREKILAKLKNLKTIGPLKNNLIYFITENDPKKVDAVCSTLNKLKIDVDVEILDIDVRYAAVECNVQDGEVANCVLEDVLLRESYEEVCKDCAEGSLFSNDAYKILEFALDTTAYPAEKAFKISSFSGFSGENKTRKRILFANTIKMLYPCAPPLLT